MIPMRAKVRLIHSGALATVEACGMTQQGLMYYVRTYDGFIVPVFPDEIEPLIRCGFCERARRWFAQYF